MDDSSASGAGLALTNLNNFLKILDISALKLQNFSKRRALEETDL